jgi:hypothetical protein
MCTHVRHPRAFLYSVILREGGGSIRAFLHHPRASLRPSSSGKAESRRPGDPTQILVLHKGAHEVGLGEIASGGLFVEDIVGFFSERSFGHPVLQDVEVALFHNALLSFVCWGYLSRSKDRQDRLPS